MNPFLNFISGIISGANPAVLFLQDVVSVVFDALRSIVAAIGKVIQDLVNFFSGILGKAANLFRYLWDNFFKRIFTKLFDAILKAHDWLESKLGPILRFLQKLRAFIDNVMNKYVKPIMNIIQRMRQFLAILKLFHVKFAEKLDARLLQIEVKMAGVFIEARRILNGIIDAVNLVIDPTKLLKHPILIISIRRSLPAIVRSVTGLPISFWVGQSNSLGVGATSGTEQPSGCGSDEDALPPSKFMSDFEGIPIFGFVSDDTEPSPDDVDSLAPLGYFGDPLPAPDGCGDTLRKLAALRDKVQDGILQAAQDAYFNAKSTVNVLGS